MKKLMTLLVMLMVGVCSAMALPFDKYTVNRSDLPEEAQKFLTTYFPKAKVSMIKVDKHLLKKTDYDVKLTNGMTVEFKNSGKWEEVDCKGKEVPDGIVPKRIKTYVTKNYPDTFITKIERTSRGFEVELNTEVEMKFDHLGTFKSVKMDD